MQYLNILFKTPRNILAKGFSAIICWFVLSVVSVNATPLFTSVERLSIPDGLPTTAVYSLMYDHSGFLWLGTPRGLIRYDGARFQVFNSSPSSDFDIPIIDASKTFIDSKGRYWLGGWGSGITLFDANLQLIEKFQNDPNNANTIRTDKIQVFFEDSKGRIWIGGYEGGLTSYDEDSKEFRHFSHDPENPESISHNRVWTITEDNKGKIWVGTSNGLNLLEDEDLGIFSRFYHDASNSNSLNNSLIRQLLIDSHDRLWVGTENGFGIFNKTNKQFTSLHPADARIATAITTIKTDNAGNVWIGTRKGVYMFDPRSMSFMQILTPGNYVLLPQDNVRDITFDNSGILWVATRYGGLAKVKFTPGLFTPVKQFELPDNSRADISRVHSMYRDSTDAIWIGTQTALLVTDSISSMPRVFQFAGVPNLPDIRAIQEAPNGEIWFGGDNGIYVLSRDRTRLTQRMDLLEGFNSQGANQIFFASDGATWIGLRLEGLLKIVGNNVSHYQFDPNESTTISYNAISRIFEDKQNNIWVGTNGGGLNRYLPLKDRFVRYLHDDQDDTTLSNNSINDIYQDVENNVWIATNAGVNRLHSESGEFHRFNESDGMRNATIKSITEDHIGNLWFSTDMGITELRQKNQYFVNYGIEVDIHSLEFSNGSSVKLSDSRFAFGGRNGFTTINLTQKERFRNAPDIRLTQLRLNREQIKSPELRDLLEPMTFPPGTHDIQLDFAILDFETPSNNRYRYRLLGLSDEWSPTSFEPFARFTGLQHGEYVFEVRGANSAGVWSDSSSKFAFSIEPTLFQSLWFRTMMILVVSSIFLFFYKSRTRMLKNQKLELEREVALRTEELVNTQKQLIESEKHHALSGIVAGVAHEINTPVGIGITATSTLSDIISGLSDRIKEGKIRKKDFLQKIEQITVSTDIILRNLNRAGELVRSFKEVAVDHASDDRRSFELHDYLEEILLSVGQQLRDKNINAELNCFKPLVIDSYPGSIAQIMTNLLLNVIVHAFPEGLEENKQTRSVKIEVQEKLHKLIVKVSDNGNGIPEEELRKIFDPFFTTNRGNGANGLGLHIVQNLLNVRLQGSITCESILGKGTSFTMEFKTNPD